MKVNYKNFRALFRDNFKDAAEFASQLPKDNLININVVSFPTGITVTVWYWADDESSVEKTER
jgi:hypothetical protein